MREALTSPLVWDGKRGEEKGNRMAASPMANLEHLF